MKAVIVAAGRGTRLYGNDAEIPKCLSEITEGKTLLDLTIENLKKHGITDIIIVTGWKKEQIQEKLGDTVTYIVNPFFATTNNMATLWLAKEAVGDEPFIYLHSDLLFHDGLIKKAIDSEGDIVLVTDTDDFDEEAMKVKLDENGNLLESSKAIPLNEAAGEWTGIIKFTSAGWKKLVPEIELLLGESQFMDYDTSALTNLAKKGGEIKIVPTEKLPWIEIDFPEDLERAKNKIYKTLIGDKQEND
ncbi:MAG: phosphocholine cytidylyltransferase family protein [Candidatus Undinarchaeales archaeon]|jgi:choline kinase|nr:phosphocholine cytidylyltransferase family protein [Candidatus Undinarchaeales archaeon]